MSNDILSSYLYRKFQFFIRATIKESYSLLFSSLSVNSLQLLTSVLPTRTDSESHFVTRDPRDPSVS